MPHIQLPDFPGMRGLLAYRPEISKPLNELAEVLLVGPSTLSRGERELIGAFVSSRNECHYCCSIHSAAAAEMITGGEQLVDEVKRSLDEADVSDKMRALLKIAAKVQQGGKNVDAEDVEKARQAGATDLEIHDSVLIAAAFCMFNRYVDGLATFTPEDPDFYRARGALLAENGYAAISPQSAKPAEKQ